MCRTWYAQRSLLSRFADNPLQLYSLVEQRDLRVQSSIARAAQRDSEDMKFIAVLGSIFLPASLVAVSPTKILQPAPLAKGRKVNPERPFVPICCRRRPFCSLHWYHGTSDRSRDRALLCKVRPEAVVLAEIFC